MGRYVKLTSHCSRCPSCKALLTLVFDSSEELASPTFFVCWSCRNILQAGIGEIGDAE